MDRSRSEIVTVSPFKREQASPARFADVNGGALPVVASCTVARTLDSLQSNELPMPFPKER